MDPKASQPVGLDPEPAAVSIDGYVFTNGIVGFDPRTREIPDDPSRQFSLAFGNLVALLEAAGASKEEVGLVTVYIPGARYRQFINEPWLATFTDEDSRPARKTNHVNLPDGVTVQLQAVAQVGARRTMIEIPGLAHRDPLPMGCRLGSTVFSSVIGPEDPATGKRVDDPLEQIQRCFDNVALFMEQAGGSLDNVGHMWVFLNDFDYQSAMVDAWVRTWPEDGQRPARKTLRYALGGDTLMQVQVAGVLGQGRLNYEIPGVHHHDPIPMGARIGDRFYSSGISASDPSGDGITVVEGLEAQIIQCEANVEAMMRSAGGSLDDILLATVLIQDFDAIPAIQSSWERLFPDRASRPPLKFIDWRIPGGSHVQYHLVGVMEHKDFGPSRS
jgi:2-iminobutanoate/2-iminopropanoate deaminase